MAEFWTQGRKGRLFLPGKDNDAAAIKAAKECGQFTRDYEEECFAEADVTCFNCRYRRWTKESFECMRKERNSNVKVIVFTFLLLAILTFQPAGKVFAAGGDGSGGGKNQPLTLVECSIPSGSMGVATDASFTLTFSKNVVAQSVRENNLNCFHLYDADGNEVDLIVNLADDQVEPDKKRIVELTPEGLLDGKNYVLIVDQALTAKSGQTLEASVEIDFSTGNEAESTSLDKEKGHFYTALSLAGVVFVVVCVGLAVKKIKVRE